MPNREHSNGPLPSPVKKRSVVIAGHKTSVSLEDAFWVELRRIALEYETTLGDLVAEVDAKRKQGNLSSALRLFVLSNLQSEAA